MGPENEVGAALWAGYSCLFFIVAAILNMIIWLKNRKKTFNLVIAIICGIPAAFLGLIGLSG